MTLALTACQSATEKKAAEDAAKDLRDRNVGIDGIEIYYGEKTADVLERLGEADSETDMGYGSGETYYSYSKVTAFGVEDSTLGVTVKSDARYDDVVYSVMLRMYTDETDELFNRVRDHISKLYSDREKYDSSEINEFEGVYYCSITANAKDGTESCEISRYPAYIDVIAFYSPFN